MTWTPCQAVRVIGRQNIWITLLEIHIWKGNESFSNRKQRAAASQCPSHPKHIQILLFWNPKQSPSNHQHHLLTPPPLLSHPPPSPQIRTKAMLFLSADSQTMPGGSRSLISPIPPVPFIPLLKNVWKGDTENSQKKKKGETKGGGEGRGGVGNIWDGIWGTMGGGEWKKG